MSSGNRFGGYIGSLGVQIVHVIITIDTNTDVIPR